MYLVQHETLDTGRLNFIIFFGITIYLPNLVAFGKISLLDLARNPWLDLITPGLFHVATPPTP